MAVFEKTAGEYTPLDVPLADVYPLGENASSIESQVYAIVVDFLRDPHAYNIIPHFPENLTDASLEEIAAIDAFLASRGLCNSVMLYSGITAESPEKIFDSIHFFPPVQHHIDNILYALEGRSPLLAILLALRHEHVTKNLAQQVAQHSIDICKAHLPSAWLERIAMVTFLFEPATSHGQFITLDTKRYICFGTNTSPEFDFLMYQYFPQYLQVLCTQEKSFLHQMAFTGVHELIHLTQLFNIAKSLNMDIMTLLHYFMEGTAMAGAELCMQKEKSLSTTSYARSIPAQIALRQFEYSLQEAIPNEDAYIQQIKLVLTRTADNLRIAGVPEHAIEAVMQKASRRHISRDEVSSTFAYDRVYADGYYMVKALIDLLGKRQAWGIDEVEPLLLKFNLAGMLQITDVQAYRDNPDLLLPFLVNQ